MNIRPTKNRVVVKATEVEEKTSGGIIIPTDSKEPPTLGKVVASGKDDMGDSFKVGDTLLFGKYAGTPIKVQDENFIIMKMDEVLAVIEK